MRSQPGRGARSTAASILQMVKHAWQANPSGFITLSILEIVHGTIPVAMAWITKVLFDALGQSIQSGTSSTAVDFLLLVIGAQVTIGIIGSITQPVGSYFYEELGRRLTANIETTIYKKINSLQGLAPFEDSRFHDSISLASGGAQFGPSQALRIFTTLARSVFTLVAFVALLMSFSFFLTIAILLATIPHLWIQLKMGQRRVDLAIKTNQQRRRVTYYSSLLSTLGHAKEVRLFNLSEFFLSKWLHTLLELQQTQRRHQVQELRWQALLATMTHLAGGIAFAAVVIQALEGRLSLGDIVLFTGAVASLQNVLLTMVTAVSSLNESVLFYSHFTKLMNIPQPIYVSVPGLTPPKLTQGIEFRNVSFRYDEHQPYVLHNLNLEIPAGQCVALVGRNGAGKSTLVKLLTRLYDPTEGQVLWDGVDIRQFDPTELRNRMAVILQDFVRYDLTVQENIGVGNLAYLDDLHQIEQVAAKAGIHERLKSLPKGYHTSLSRWLVEREQSADLSGGEWQKIALARMLMRSSDLLILDEPTAALDVQAEYELYEHFTQLMRGRTGLLITHRFSTVRMADKIAVLENGQIAEFSTHEELLSLGGIYTKLYSMQAERYR